MTKREKKAVNKFVVKMLRSGGCVGNDKLPRKLWYGKKKAASTVILPFYKFIRAWNTLRKQLES